MFGLSPEAFKINKDSGLITSRRRLQSYERFNLTVVATDKGHPPLWGTTMLHVEVIDINDNRPIFVRPPNGTILHIKEVHTHTHLGLVVGREPWHTKAVPRSVPAGGQTHSLSPPGMKQDPGLAHGKKVWVLLACGGDWKGLLEQGGHLCCQTSPDARPASEQSQRGILGNRNPSSKQNREMAGCCMPGMFINTGQNADI